MGNIVKKFENFKDELYITCKNSPEDNYQLHNMKDYLVIDENIDYEKIYNDFKLNNQYWFAKLKDGSILSCGYGLVENEFNGDTWFEIGKIIPDELKSIDGYYTFDETHDLINDNGIKIGKLSDIGYNSHPDENSFVLIPKSDIIETYFK
jgi:hypothetical protein